MRKYNKIKSMYKNKNLHFTVFIFLPKYESDETA